MGCTFSLPVSIHDEIKEIERFVENEHKQVKPIKKTIMTHDQTKHYIMDRY